MEELSHLIETCCGDIRLRISSCHNRQIAGSLVVRLCSELQARCTDSRVQEALVQHAEDVMRLIFDRHGRNKLLEKPDE